MFYYGDNGTRRQTLDDSNQGPDAQLYAHRQKGLGEGWTHHHSHETSQAGGTLCCAENDHTHWATLSFEYVYICLWRWGPHPQMPKDKYVGLQNLVTETPTYLHVYNNGQQMSMSPAAIDTPAYEDISQIRSSDVVKNQGLEIIFEPICTLRISFFRWACFCILVLV